MRTSRGPENLGGVYVAIETKNGKMQERGCDNRQLLNQQAVSINRRWDKKHAAKAGRDVTTESYNKEAL